MSPAATSARPARGDGWHIAKAQGLPKRYITSVQIDPSDPRTVYVTLGGYCAPLAAARARSARTPTSAAARLQVHRRRRDVPDISGNLPDIPANWTLVHDGQLLVATDLGVFVSSDTSGGRYEALGSGLPTAPVLSLELKPKASAGEPDTLVAATQGRGVYKLRVQGPGEAARRRPGPGARTGAKVKRAGRGLKLSFKRSVRKPVRSTSSSSRSAAGSWGSGSSRASRTPRRRSAGTGARTAGRQKVRDGIFMVRFRLKVSNGLIDNRRIDQVRRRAASPSAPPHYGREGCTLINSFKLERPVFGGTNRKSLGIAYRLLNPAKVTVTVKRGEKVVKRYTARTRRGNRTHRLRSRRRAASGATTRSRCGRSGVAARRRGRSRHGSSKADVTGPSLTSSTSMWAPKRPRRAPARSQKRS